MKSSMNEFMFTPFLLRNFLMILISLENIQGAVVRPNGILLNMYITPFRKKQKYFLNAGAIHTDRNASCTSTMPAQLGCCNSLRVFSRCSILNVGVNMNWFKNERSIIGRMSVSSLGTVNSLLTWTFEGISH